jgi:hypothetical protein
MDDLYKWVNPKTGKHSPMISKETHDIITKNADVSRVNWGKNENKIFNSIGL